MIWRIIYNIIVVPLGWGIFRILGLFNNKVHRGIIGRRNLFSDLERTLSQLPPTSKRVWFHSSSMGEFEQAKPIIAEIKKKYPDVKVIVSFFSPSGYEPSQSYKLADSITYLPFDSHRNAKRFVEIVKPAVVIIVRYDLWPNHIWALSQLHIPIFIANATLQRKTARNFPFVRQFHKSLYNSIGYILTVSEADKAMFESFQLSHPVIEVIGDTRYDQVWQRSTISKNRHFLPSAILQNRKIVVIGSSWKEDEEKLFPVLIKLVKSHQELLFILVPHEPNVETLERIESQLNGQLTSIRFSTLGDYRDESMIIIDSVGILMALYQYAHVAYIGGSFKQGVHNVLEPAAYGIPLVIGPKHENSQEALSLVSERAAVVGASELELYNHFQYFIENENNRHRAGQSALEFVQRHTGATKRFLSYLEKVL